MGENQHFALRHHDHCWNGFLNFTLKTYQKTALGQLSIKIMQSTFAQIKWNAKKMVWREPEIISLLWVHLWSLTSLDLHSEPHLAMVVLNKKGQLRQFIYMQLYIVYMCSAVTTIWGPFRQLGWWVRDPWIKTIIPTFSSGSIIDDSNNQATSHHKLTKGQNLHSHTTRVS